MLKFIKILLSLLGYFVVMVLTIGAVIVTCSFYSVPSGFKLTNIENSSEDDALRADDLVVSLEDKPYNKNVRVLYITDAKGETVSSAEIESYTDEDKFSGYLISGDGEESQEIGSSQVIGQIYYVIPKVGILFRNIDFQTGILVLLAHIFILLILLNYRYWIRIFRRNKDNDIVIRRAPPRRIKIKSRDISIKSRKIGNLRKIGGKKKKSVDSLVVRKTKN